MNKDYAPRDCIPLQPGTSVAHPSELPEYVHLNDPATTTFIDFTVVKPETITADMPIDAAHAKLQTTGNCLLLVTDKAGALEGILTWDECQGDAPIKQAEKHHIGHREIRVGMVMTPLQDIKVMEWSHLKDALVGHIVSTLHQLECEHLLVVENNKVRGMFAARQIAKQIGHAVTGVEVPVHSLAEIVRTLHH